MKENKANKKSRIAIYGAGGLTGRELLRLLAHHPFVEPVFVSSNKYAGKTVGEVFRGLAFSSGVPGEAVDRIDARSATNLQTSSVVFSRHEEPLPEDVELVLLATPNETSLELLPALLKRGLRVIDLSGSFRLHDQKVWESHYKLKHTAFDYLDRDQVVFGLPELFRERIQSARAVANPGCYPTAPIIALNILGDLRTELLSVTIDAKSGVSGAGGRTEDAGFAFSGVYENFRAYKILRHQHEPEIHEYGLENLRSDPQELPHLVFTPHLLPLNRGILSTMVLHWKNEAPADLKDRFRIAAEKEMFLRFFEEPEEIELRHVQYTNFVDLALRSEGRTTVLVSAIDNLLKGAAGQAMQNLNLMLGYPESTGLL